MKKFLLAALVITMFVVTPLVSSADVPAPGGPFNTAFRVQNLSQAVAHCAVAFYDANGGSGSSITLPDIAVGDSAYVYMPTVNINAGQYDGVVSCDQDVAAVVNYSNAGGTEGASYSGFSQTATNNTLYAPAVYNNYYNYYSDIIVQNASGGPVDIKLEVFLPGNPNAVLTENRTAVPSNGFVTFEQEGKAQLAAQQFYSAKISATGPIAAIANIYGRGPVSPQLYSYTTFPPSNSTTAYAPVMMSNYYGYNSALVIQNMGSQPANVTIKYGNGVQKTTTIQPGAADSRLTKNDLGNPINFLTGAQVVSTNNQPIVVIVNESTATNRAASYEGFRAGTTTVRAPIVMRSYYKYNTSVTCQNVGNASTTMTIAYSGVASTFTTPSVPANGTYLFLQQSDNLLNGKTNWIGSATVTSTQPIVCVVNEDMNMPPDNAMVKDMLYSYDGIGQ